MALKSQKLKLITVLASVKEFVVRSDENIWIEEDLKEIVLELNQIISHIINPDEYELPETYSALFAPTGPIQEIAISNGWHGVYLELAAEYDDVAHMLRQ